MADTGASWQNIPLANGAKYCDGSEGSSSTTTGPGTGTTTGTAATSSGSGGAGAGTGDEEPDCDDESGDGKSLQILFEPETNGADVIFSDSVSKLAWSKGKGKGWRSTRH